MEGKVEGGFCLWLVGFACRFPCRFQACSVSSGSFIPHLNRRFVNTGSGIALLGCIDIVTYMWRHAHTLSAEGVAVDRARADVLVRRRTAISTTMPIATAATAIPPPINAI